MSFEPADLLKKLTEVFLKDYSSTSTTIFMGYRSLPMVVHIIVNLGST